MPGRRLSADDVIHGAQFAAPGDTYGALTTQEQASATVHACLAAGIRWFDTAPLYTDCALHQQIPMPGAPPATGSIVHACAQDASALALVTFAD